MLTEIELRNIAFIFRSAKHIKWWFLGIWPLHLPLSVKRGIWGLSSLTSPQKSGCLSTLQEIISNNILGKEFLQLPSMSGKPHDHINFTSILGAWNQFHHLCSTLRTKKRPVHITVWKLFYTRPLLRLLSMNEINSFLSSFLILYPPFCKKKNK